MRGVWRVQSVVLMQSLKDHTLMAYWEHLQLLISTIRSQLSLKMGTRGPFWMSHLWFCSEHVWTTTALSDWFFFTSENTLNLSKLSGDSPPVLDPTLLETQWLVPVVYPKWGVLVLDRHLEDYLGASKHSCVIRHRRCQSCRSKELIGWVSNKPLPLGMSLVECQ